MEESESLIKSLDNSPPIYFGSKLESRRWWILLCFGIYNMLASMTWITYNTISGLSMEYYGINESQVLLFSDCGIYANLLFSFITCWYAFKRFKNTFLFCVASMTVGTWMRYAVGSNYALALVGQIITQIATSPIFGFATLIPIRWFSAKERFLVTTISIYSNNVGLAIGTILGPLLAQEDSKRVPYFLLTQAIITTFCLILGLIFMKDQPKESPSYSALVELIDPSSFWQEIKKMIKIPRFIPSALCFGILLGVSYSISTVGAMYLEPFGLSYLEKGFIQLSYVICGTSAGLLGTIWIVNNSVKDYDFMIRTFLTFSLLALAFSGVVLWKTENPSLLMIIIAHCLLGLGLIGASPFLFSAIVEITFPIQDSLTSNSLYMLAQLLNLLTGRLMIEVLVSKLGLIVLAIFMVPSWLYGTFIYKTDYKRRNADEKHKIIEKNIQDSIEKFVKEEEFEEK